MVQHEKAILRQEMLARRNSLSDGERKEKSDAIMARLFEERHFREARCVALYMPIGNEVDTRQMITRSVAEGKEVLLPFVASDHHLELRKFESFERLEKGRFAILEPISQEKPVEDPHVIILPGVAFGLCMHRLGYGKGYYDRLLARLPSFRIGICFDVQVLDRLPRHSDDQRMNVIITEKREIV
jgi:5-formyltetrahydrofolate cyclo-ligase